MFEQPLLEVETAAVSPESSVGGDDAVARDDDRDRVAAVGGADRTRRPGPADAPGELGVAPRRSQRNLAQSLPYLR